MRLMGVDYARNKVGIAISDETQKMPFPLTVLTNNKKIIENIKKICGEYNIKKIILGLPLDLKNQPTHNTKPAENFKLKLEKELIVPVIFEKEFYTTKEAERVQGKVKNIDASAAALILKHYIDKLK